MSKETKMCGGINPTDRATDEYEGRRRGDQVIITGGGMFDGWHGEINCFENGLANIFIWRPDRLESNVQWLNLRNFLPLAV